MIIEIYTRRAATRGAEAKGAQVRRGAENNGGACTGSDGRASGTTWAFRDESMHMAFAMEVYRTARAEEPEIDRRVHHRQLGRDGWLREVQRARRAAHHPAASTPTTTSA